MKKRNKTYPARARQPTNIGAAPSVKNSGYSEGGASRTRTALRGYYPLKSSTKADVDVNLPLLRSRSTDLFYNSAIGAGALNSSHNNAIGAGLRVSPKIDYKLLGLTAEQAKEWQRNTLREFNLWAESKACDLYRKNKFYDMQDIVYLSYLIDGDAWAAIKYRKLLPGCPYCTRIQLFEASRVCNPDATTAFGPVSPWAVETINPKNGNRIINGVEIDADGAIVAYWIANRVPFDLTNPAGKLDWVRVEAYGKRSGRLNVLQISHEERPEQYRGVPYIVPAIWAMCWQVPTVRMKELCQRIWTASKLAQNAVPQPAVNAKAAVEAERQRVNELEALDSGDNAAVTAIINRAKADNCG